MCVPRYKGFEEFVLISSERYIYIFFRSGVTDDPARALEEVPAVNNSGKVRVLRADQRQGLVRSRLQGTSSILILYADEHTHKHTRTQTHTDTNTCFNL